MAARVLLVGGGHAHLEVLRRLALEPDAAIEATLVSPSAWTPYSGRLPGHVAGHDAFDDAHVSLRPLAAAAGATFVEGRVVALDPDARRATLGDGRVLAFDAVSLDVGATAPPAIEGAAQHAVAVRPVEPFLAAWRATCDDVAAGHVRRIAVVGAGVGGIEIALAMHHRLAQRGGPAASFALVSAATSMPAMLARRLRRHAERRGFALHVGEPVVRIDDGRVVLRDATTIAADRVFVATGPRADAWPAASGLACDAAGFVLTDAALRSRSHPNVFAAGDCASNDAHPHPKSGVYAVRQGPVLAGNIRAHVHGRALARFAPQRLALALVSTGGRHAVASYGAIAFEGDWVWRWKHAIDARFLARYRTPLRRPGALE